MSKESEEHIDNALHSPFPKNLWVKILVGMFAGVVVGLLISPYGFGIVDKDVSSILATWIRLPGTFFLGMIQMVVIPLILCSIILGITQSGELGFLKKIGLRVILYFITTTIIAISIAMLLVHTINPGKYIDQELIQSFQVEQEFSGDNSAKTFENLTIPQRIENLIPTNIPNAVIEKNLLQIVIAAMIVGVALVTMPKATAQPILSLSVSGQALSMKVIGWAMIIAPYAVFGLICDITIKLGFTALLGMGMYMATVIAGLLLMVFVYILIAKFIGGYGVFDFLKAIRATQLLAFSTSSSAATMPFTLACAEENLKIPPKIARFVIPLGATINMDGTALYQAVAAIFLVQIFGAAAGVELSTADMILLMVTTVGASIGTPATPGVGIVVLATILTSIGIPPAAVGFILGVDRILDMCRTSVNVTGDLTASIVMNKWLK